MAAMTTPTTTTPPLCKHWARSKSCLYHSQGGNCKFDHPIDYELPPQSQVRRKRSKGGRLQVKNDTRAAKLRSFMALHVNLEQSHVLDVAGGKGELAFHLVNLSNVASCHVVDPRPLSLNRFQVRLQRGFYHRSASIVNKDIVTSPNDAERPVEHLRCFFASELWDKDDSAIENEVNDKDKNKNISKNKNNEAAFETNCQNAQAWTWPPANNNEHASSSSCSCNNDNDDDESKTHYQLNNKNKKQTPTFEHARSIVQQATLIVGMHPDQAVDAIIDAALALGVSFFVVPCCTYSQEFPHRRTPSNSKKIVTTYEELLEYLQSKSPDIQRAELPFEGKNVCLYRVVE